MTLSGKPAALLVGTLKHAHKEWEALGKYAELKTYSDGTREDFLAKCKTEFQNVKAICRTYNSKFYMGIFDKEIIDNLPPSVKFICHLGAGYETVDVAACTARGIQVSHVPKAVDDATADVGIFLMLGALRGFNQGIFELHKNNWNANCKPSHDPEGKTLGILGLGGIGKTMAKRARAFDMKIVYHNRTPLPEEEAEGAEFVSFDDLLAKSDVLSLNLPLNAHTRHIIGKPEFQKMKRGIVIVNTARGAVMDEAALVEALDEGIVYSAGLDVFEEEPKIHPGLLENEKVILLPHLGTNSLETQYKMECAVLMNVKNGIVNDSLPNLVPEQRGDKE